MTMRKLLLYAALCLFVGGGLSSCDDYYGYVVMPILNYDGKRPPAEVEAADLVGEWKATGHAIGATWLDGERLPIEFDMARLRDLVEWYYTFEEDGYGRGQETRMNPNQHAFGGSVPAGESVEYDFSWEVSGIELYLTSAIQPSDGGQYLYGAPGRGWYVTQLSSEKLVLYKRTYKRDAVFGETFWHAWYIFEKVED